MGPDNVSKFTKGHGASNLASGRGGRRPGAGRPRGKRDRATRESLAEAERTGELPLAYLLRVMRDESVDVQRRDAMALAAAPFLHPRLQAIAHDPKPAIDLSSLTDEELHQIITIQEKLLKNAG